MIQLSYQRLLALLCFVVFIGVLASCKKDSDDTRDDGSVQLLSFGPTGAEHGDTVRFFGRNLNKVNEVLFTGSGASVKQNEFKKQTAEEILLLVPESAERGYVTLKTPSGDLVSKTMFNLNVSSSITVTSLTEQARPGADITLSGNYLNWVKSITFARNKVVTSFVSQAFDKLVVTVPEDAQTGPLVIEYAGTDSSSFETADTLKVVLPLATAFSPNPVRHAGNVTITGTDLDLTQKVYFIGVPAAVTTFESKTATQLVVKVPGTAKKGKVTLEAASGVTTTSGTDLDIAMPAITGMTPNPVAPDANVTIAGTNLDLVSAVSFTGVNNSVTSFESQTATQLVVKVPANAVTGKLTLSVKNSTLSVQSSGDLAIIGSTVPPIIIYSDASAWSGWTGGGWGGTKDVDNTSPVRSGSKSVKIEYTSGGWGVPWQLGGANISLGGYQTLKVSIYGGAGSSGKSINIGFNELDGKTVQVVEGQWTDFEIPLSQISSASTLTHLYIKNYTASGAYTIYVDNLGIY